MDPDKILKKKILETNCLVCGKPMTIVNAVAFTIPDFQNLQGCFKCGKCGRYTCYEHSFNDRVCECGEVDWHQSAYVHPMAT